RVFGTVLFRARERVAMPPPGSALPARLEVELRDFLWDVLYRPAATAVGAAARILNRVQFLTIRAYLSLVFGALVALLTVLASWFFRVAPYLIFAATWVAAALVPTFAAGLIFSYAADVIAIVALLATARFVLALAGLDVGTSFGGIGASREMMISSLAEPAML